MLEAFEKSQEKPVLWEELAGQRGVRLTDAQTTLRSSLRDFFQRWKNEHKEQAERLTLNQVCTALGLSKGSLVRTFIVVARFSS